jgi:hypothetical protein
LFFEKNFRQHILSKRTVSFVPKFFDPNFFSKKFGRAPQSAKSPFAAFFLRDLPAKQGNVQLFFFGGMLDPKEKAGEQKQEASRET